MLNFRDRIPKLFKILKEKLSPKPGAQESVIDSLMATLEIEKNNAKNSANVSEMYRAWHLENEIGLILPIPLLNNPAGYDLRSFQKIGDAEITSAKEPKHLGRMKCQILQALSNSKSMKPSEVLEKFQIIIIAAWNEYGGVYISPNDVSKKEIDDFLARLEKISAN